MPDRKGLAENTKPITKKEYAWVRATDELVVGAAGNLQVTIAGNMKVVRWRLIDTAHVRTGVGLG